MKADYLRNIFECLAGDAGLLQSKNCDAFNVPENFNDDLNGVYNMEINRDEIEIDCIICNPNFNEADKEQRTEAAFFIEEHTLIDFMKHQVIHEYEKAKQQVFDKEFNLIRVKDPQDDILKTAAFHTSFLSSLMNQQVFRRECVMSEEKLNCKEQNADQQKDTVLIKRKSKIVYKEICDYMQGWLNMLDTDQSLLESLLSEDRKLAMSLLELIEK